MRILGLVVNHNSQAVLLGVVILLTEVVCVYLAQKLIFEKYRWKVPNVRENKDDNE